MGSNLSRPCVNKILTWFVEWLVSGMSLSFRSSLVYSWKRKTLARWVTPCIYDLSRIKLFIDQFKHWATLIKHTIKLDYFKCQCNGEPVLSMTLSFERSFSDLPFLLLDQWSIMEVLGMNYWSQTHFPLLKQPADIHLEHNGALYIMPSLSMVRGIYN